MRILAIDPGSEMSAWLVYETETRRPVEWAKVPNVDLFPGTGRTNAQAMAIETVASYGMAVGAEVFSTCVWSGRLIERWMYSLCAECEPRQIFRREVKLHLCGSARAKDANIRQALIDRYGGKETAIGRKASPGPLYGISGDCWSALAVAVTAVEIRAQVAA